MFKNWKTTLPGVLALFIQFAPSVGLPQKYANAISSVAVAVGLAQAKDHDVTGDGK